MPKPADKIKANYMFSDDIKFLQKVIVIDPSNNKFLAIKRSQNDTSRPGKWDLPGGNVHFGEKHDESLKREIKEETQLEIRDLIPLQVDTMFKDNIYHLFIGYKAFAVTSDVSLSFEHTEYKWLSSDEFLRLDSADFLQRLVNLIK